MEIRNNQGLSDSQLLAQQKERYEKMTEAVKGSPIGKFTADLIAKLEAKLKLN